MRKLRRIIHILVPATGMALVIGAVLFGESLAVQLFVVVVGLLLTEAGIWRLIDPFLPDERKSIALRREGDHFMALVRQLDAVALALDGRDDSGSRFALDEVRTEMHRSVDRMVGFAGQPGEDASLERGGRADTEPGAVRARSES